MSDIRKFFTQSQGRPPKSPIKTALTDERKLRGSPVKAAKKQPTRRPEKHVPITIGSDSDDFSADFEDPLPSSVKAEMKKKPRRCVVMDTSEEEFFDESIGTKITKKDEKAKPKRSTRKALESDSDFEEPPAAPTNKKRKARILETPSPVKVQPKRSRVAVIESSDESPQPKGRGRKSAKAREASVEPMDVEIVESSEEEHVEAPKKGRRGRRRTPPNQTKIDAILTKSIPASKRLPKILPTQKVLEKVDPLDFFNETKPPTPKTKQPPPKVPEVVEMTDTDTEPETKKPKASPVKPATQKKSITPKKAESPKKVTPVKVATPKKAEAPKKTPPTKATKTGTSKDVSKKQSAPKKDAKMNLKDVKFQTYRHPTPPKALPALPPPQRAELPWVDKYKPASLKDLVGQGTPASPTNKLLKWLKEWAKNNLGVNGMIKKPKPSNYFGAPTDGTAFKAALCSGPPGIGKTSSVVLVCKELGLKYIEMNASDTRNKKLLQEKISQLLGSRQVNQFFSGEKPKIDSNSVSHVLIMDEVDGMSGVQDRSGISELIDMIKTSMIPIICICNDRMSTKIRSLANHCFDLRFQRPSAVQIKARLMTIKTRERINISPEVLDKIIEASNQDVRQCVYSLQLYASGAKGKFEKKDISVNIFEAARKILSKESSLAEKQELYFSDYSIMPLFVHENYPHVRADGINNLTHLNAIRRAASCIAEADLIDKQVRSNGGWSLLPEHGMLSCALPAMHLEGHMTSQLQFPAWLGKNSSGNKRQRMMRLLASHSHLKITGTCHSLVTDYLPVLRDRIYRPLVKKEAEGVREVVDIFKHYDLTRDDTEAINELGVWPDARDIAQNVNSKTKAALTRTLNKENRKLPYSVITEVKGRKKAVGNAEVILDEEGHEVERKFGAGSDDEVAEEEDDAETPEVKVKITTNDAKASGAKRGGATAARGGRGRGRGRGKA